MIRRFYVLPLKRGVSDDLKRRFLRDLQLSDRIIPGLRNSAAGFDLAGQTVVRENELVDEDTYTGSYMVHPYHSATIDDYLMADSPSCLTHDIYATRRETAAPSASIRRGIRRLVLMNLPQAEIVDAVAALSAAPSSWAGGA